MAETEAIADTLDAVRHRTPLLDELTTIARITLRPRRFARAA